MGEEEGEEEEVEEKEAEKFDGWKHDRNGRIRKWRRGRQRSVMG